MNQGIILGSPVVKWIALAAVVAILAALLMASVVRAQDDGVIEYAENGTDPVLTLTATDPEMRMVYWSLPDGDPMGFVPTDLVDTGDFAESDFADFTITPTGDGASATLNFNFPPDFETKNGWWHGRRIRHLQHCGDGLRRRPRRHWSQYGVPQGSSDRHRHGRGRDGPPSPPSSPRLILH